MWKYNQVIIDSDCKSWLLTVNEHDTQQITFFKNYFPASVIAALSKSLMLFAELDYFIVILDYIFNANGTRIREGRKKKNTYLIFKSRLQ